MGGILIFIGNDRVFVSKTFEGSMEYTEEGSIAQKVMEQLTYDKVSDEREFVKLVDDLHDQLYGYSTDFKCKIFEYTDIPELSEKLVSTMLDDVGDYAYILNASDEDIEVKDDDNIVVKIPTEEGAVFYCGGFDETSIQHNWDTEVITDPYDTEFFPDEVWVISLQKDFDFTEDEAKEIVHMRFHECHDINGCYNSVTEVGEITICDIYMDDNAYNQLMPYLDVESFGRDFVRENEGYYELESGRVLIYNP